MITAPQSYGARGYSSATTTKTPHDAPWGRAAKDPAWSMEIGDGGFPTGRLRHRNGNVMRRKGGSWKGVRP